MIRECKKVRFVDEAAHEKEPQFYPAPGTIGTVTTVLGPTCCFVQWPNGTTSGGDEWAVPINWLEVAE